MSDVTLWIVFGLWVVTIVVWLWLIWRRWRDEQLERLDEPEEFTGVDGPYPHTWEQRNRKFKK